MLRLDDVGELVHLQKSNISREPLMYAVLVVMKKWNVARASFYQNVIKIFCNALSVILSSAFVT